VSYPGSSQFVTSVGGNDAGPRRQRARLDGDRVGGLDSGCSAYIRKPGWQKDRLCDLRTVADVAAVADPQTGSPCTTRSASRDGSCRGTSLSSPIIASVYAMAGNTASVRYGVGPYRASSALFDVIGGSNGACSGTYMCNALPGYDGPTGLERPTDSAPSPANEGARSHAVRIENEAVALSAGIAPRSNSGLLNVRPLVVIRKPNRTRVSGGHCDDHPRFQGTAGGAPTR